MPKRICGVFLILCLSFSALWGYADGITGQDHTDVPGMPTQDSVRWIQVLFGYQCEAQPADDSSMNLLRDVFRFVYEEQNRPVRYYDDLTQAQIQALIDGVDPDLLHMSEHMTVLCSPEDGVPSESDVYSFDLFLDVDYVPGQLVVAVFGTGYSDPETLTWYPYLCQVPERGRITLSIPKEDMERFQGQPVLLQVLTDRIGLRDGVWTEEELVERIVRPSKSEEELRRVVRYYAQNGVPLEEDFRVFTVPMTGEMADKIEAMRLFLEENPSLYHYFTSDIHSEIHQVFPAEIDVDDLIAYEIVAVQDENYRDTYGDVAVTFQFATNYHEDQSHVAILGFPKKSPEPDSDEVDWEWTCMYASGMDEGLEAIFEQLMLIRLEEEPGLLLILSDPIPTDN